MKKLLVIIPAYNESGSIEQLVREISQLKHDVHIEILVVNDCSTDATKKVLMQINVPHINLPINLGIGGAVQTGFKYACIYNFDYAMQLDGDGQHPPSNIPVLLDKIIKGNADVVIGSRFITKTGFQSSKARRIGIKLFKSLISILCHITITDATSGLRIYNKKAIHFLSENYPDEYPEPETAVIMHLNNFNIIEIPVIMKQRLQGKSSINSFKSIYYMFKVSLAIIFSFIRYKNANHV